MWRDRLAFPAVNKNDVIQGAVQLCKNDAKGCKLATLAYHPIKKVNKAG
jgi:hypothetical protein